MIREAARRVPYPAFLWRSAGAAGYLSLSFSEGTTPDSGTVTVDWAVRVGPTIPVKRSCSAVRGA